MRATSSSSLRFVVFRSMRPSSSRNLSPRILASSKPSATSRGCRPSCRYRSAWCSISPISSTADVVPSPVMSSCAVAVRAISAAVGFWICISSSSTFPSFVSLMSPEPDTSLALFSRPVIRRCGPSAVPFWAAEVGTATWSHRRGHMAPQRARVVSRDQRHSARRHKQTVGPIVLGHCK